MSKVPTMGYRVPMDGDDTIETENGPVAYKVFELEAGEGLPGGWAASPVDVKAGTAEAPKRRGRPPKVEEAEPDVEGE